MPMKNPPHPGRIIRQECIDALGLSITDGAKALGVSRNALSELVNERRGVSPEMAIRLDKAFGGGADTWHRMQSAYDMAQALKGAHKIMVQRVRQAVIAAE
jgi:addiction module HigA family antidote